MAVVMAQPVLLSCTAKKKELIVKEDDPWYESYRFSLETDRLDTELLEGSVVSYSNGKLYHLYSLINNEDYENYRRTLLDTYDEKGNLLNRFSLKNPGDYELNRVLAIRPKDGNKAEAVADLFAKGGFENAVVDIDLETGDVTDPRFLRDKEGKLCTNDCSDYELEVCPGDEVSIIEETSRGYYVKNKGTSGWYRGRIREK